MDVAKGIHGSGIVYVRSRKETAEIAKLYNDNGINADYYHAGLTPELRSQKQENWKNNRLRIIVATNAFGMGIDKPDVRFVIHKDPPESLEAYYQEAGRGGRDEQTAYAVLLYNQADRFKQQKKFELNFPSIAEIKQAYHHLANYCQVAYEAGEGLSFDLDLADFCSRFKLDIIKTINALKFLELDEYVSFNESVYLPSRFRFEVANEELYNFQIQNPGWDPFIKTLLRSYGGSFENYVNLREFDLARRTLMNVQQVTDGLNQLQEYKLLSYQQQTDKPQITWLKPRQQSNGLYINKKAIDERKETYRKKMEAVFAYAEHQKCRSQMLLAYFDEPNALKCGVCDICLQEKRQKKASEIFEDITSEIIQQLSITPLDTSSLVSSIKTGNEKEKINVIRLLLDAGKIRFSGEKLVLRD